MLDLASFPAGSRISKGIEDLAAQRLTIDALMVAVASRRLSELGLPIPPPGLRPSEPELSLYELLRAQSEDPFLAYRAILNELDSFISCFEAAGSADAQ